MKISHICLVLVVLVSYLSFSNASALPERGHEEEENHQEKEEHGMEEEDHHEEGFEYLLEKTNSQLNDALTPEAFQYVLKAVNENCMNATQIFDLLGVESSLGEKVFADAAVILAYRMKTRHHDNSCDDDEFKVNITTEDLFDGSEVCREDIAALIEAAKENEKFALSNEGTECFGSATLLSECTTDIEEIHEALSNLVIFMAGGRCFLPEPSYFRAELIEFLNADSQGIVTEENFENLLDQLNLGSTSMEDGHGHGGEEGHEGEEDHDDEDDHDDQGSGEEEEGHSGEEGHEDEEESNEEDDRTEISKRSVEVDEHEEENHHDEEEEGHPEESSMCYSPSQLLTIAGQNRDAEGNLILTSQGLLEICPAILQQYVSGACRQSPHTDEVERPTADATYTQTQKYGYGTLSVLIISLLALGGLLLFPSIGSFSYKMIMQFFIALGVGTLSGDALLHLIPEVVGLHGHGGEDDGHGHGEDEEEDQSYLYKLLVVIVGIYVFYLFENVLRLYNQISKKKLSLHAHHHDSRKHSHSTPGLETGSNHKATRMVNTLNGTSTNHQEENGEVKDLSEKDTKESNPDAVCCGVTSVGIMVFIGDALHNFGDGLALGVAFSSSPVAGIGASIAIFCHELPHEFGDFAIYLKNGMTKWQGLGMNLLAACCAFIGLYVGLSVSENEEARQWMLAVVAGMFLYIALVDVLHEMIEEVSEDHPILMFFLQNVGLCLGWAILLLLALYEDAIGNSFRA